MERQKRVSDSDNALSRKENNLQSKTKEIVQYAATSMVWVPANGKECLKMQEQGAGLPGGSGVSG